MQLKRFPLLGSRLIEVAADFTLKPVIGFFDYASKYIDENLKISDNRLKPDKDGKIKSIFPGYEELDRAFSPTELTKSINERYFKPFLPQIKEMVITLKNTKPLNRFIGNRLGNVEEFVEAIPKYLKSFLEVLKTGINGAFEFQTGLLVGIINSLVDLLKTVFDILSLICSGVYTLIKEQTKFYSSPSAYFGTLIESLENGLEIIANAFSLKNLKALFDFQKFIVFKSVELGISFYKYFFNSETETTDKKEENPIPIVTIGYYTGYIIGLIAQEVLIFMATAGVGTIAEGIRGTIRSYAEIGKAIGKTVGKTVTVTVDSFLKLMQTAKSFVKEIPKHLDTLKVWVDELLASLTKVFSNEVVQLFNKLGVTIKKVPKQPVLAIGIPVKISDNVYALIKDGKEIFRGTKQEVKDVAKKLDELSEVDAKRYLDETKNIINAYEELLDSFPALFYALDEVRAKTFYSRWISAIEEAVIKFYTGGIYKHLNDSLRFSKEIENIVKLKKLLNRALSKLPSSKHNSNLKRSTYFSEEDIVKLFPENGIFTEKGFFSTTYSDEALNAWLKSNLGDNVIFKVTGKNGKLIEKASQLPHEAEVLFMSGTSFEVKKVHIIDHPVDKQELIYEIILKEI